MILYGLRYHATFRAVPKRITDVYFRVFDSVEEATNHIEVWRSWLIQNIEPGIFGTLYHDSIKIEIIPFEYIHSQP